MIEQFKVAYPKTWAKFLQWYYNNYCSTAIPMDEAFKTFEEEVKPSEQLGILVNYHLDRRSKELDSVAPMLMEAMKINEILLHFELKEIESGIYSKD